MNTLEIREKEKGAQDIAEAITILHKLPEIERVKILNIERGMLLAGDELFDSA